MQIGHIDFCKLGTTCEPKEANELFVGVTFEPWEIEYEPGLGEEGYSVLVMLDGTGRMGLLHGGETADFMLEQRDKQELSYKLRHHEATKDLIQENDEYNLINQHLELPTNPVIFTVLK